MLPQEIIRKKRDGEKLSEKEIKEFISGVTDGSVSEGQVAALCMCILLNKMDREERVSLTSSMAKSGTVMDWSFEDLTGPILDKHSTGGVGDKVSLMLAPIIAACGGFIPMLSGRGLGHTGGTLDKMDSIAGYVSQPNIDLFKKTVKDVGCAIIGATPDLAPADRIIYSIRDVTSTVESIDLIVASILSKKLAAGLDGLVMDIKFGTGAFMQKYDDAKTLAKNLISVANGAGMPTVGVLTDMNQVLGHSAGNAVEVLEAVEYLKNENIDSRLHKVTEELAVQMLLLGKLAKDDNEARSKIKIVLESGKALDIFGKMVTALGGSSDFIDNPKKYLKAATQVKDCHSNKKGFVTGIDTRAIGIGIIELGGGRVKPSDIIDHSVGLTNIVQIGDEVGLGAKPLAIIHSKNEDGFNNMSKILEDAIIIGDKKDESRDVIKEIIYNV